MNIKDLKGVLPDDVIKDIKRRLKKQKKMTPKQLKKQREETQKILQELGPGGPICIEIWEDK